MIAEYKRFQLEATKLGRNVVFQVTVFEKSDKQRTRLFAETQCSDPYNFMIQFIIREAKDFDELLGRFHGQLEHRGFTPLRFRVRDERSWGEWSEISAAAAAPV